MSTLPDQDSTKLTPTPRPWSQSHRECANGMWNTQIYDAKGEAVATLAWYPFQIGNVTHTLREANAEFIVRACNAHDDLVAALKAAAEHLDYIGYGDSYEREGARETKLEERITAAIAKAEGR